MSTHTLPPTPRAIVARETRRLRDELAHYLEADHGADLHGVEVHATWTNLGEAALSCHRVAAYADQRQGTDKPPPGEITFDAPPAAPAPDEVAAKLRRRDEATKPSCVRLIEDLEEWLAVRGGGEISGAELLAAASRAFDAGAAAAVDWCHAEGLRDFLARGKAPRSTDNRPAHQDPARGPERDTGPGGEANEPSRPPGAEGTPPRVYPFSHRPETDTTP